MSFKRDGNDASLLSNLQKRLVSDLLVSHIPSDEAKMLSNGRFTCTVCSYRPVFDTLDVLAIHRKGKKHIQNLAYYLEKRSKEKSLDQSQNKLKRTYETLAVASSTYSSCCKKRKKLTDRKINLNLKQTNSLSSTAKVDEGLTSTTVSSYLKSMKTKSSFQSEIDNMKRRYNSPINTNIMCTESINCNSVPTFKAKKVDYKVNEELLEKNRKQLELFRDGWKCNADGEWVKDDEAEFDTDEETPI